MKTSIKGVLSNLLVNTVLLTRNHQNPDNIYLLRCYKCGSAINQVQGLIWSISAGYLPSVEVPTISKCPKCSENYTFQTFESVKRADIITDLIISADPKSNTFHCIICRQPLMQYNKEVAILLPEFDRFRMPAQFSCFTPNCLHKYYLNDIVEPVVI